MRSGTPAITSPQASASRIKPASGNPPAVHARKRTGVGSPFWSANTATAAATSATTR
jgi:hypothetical protein